MKAVLTVKRSDKQLLMSLYVLHRYERAGVRVRQTSSVSPSAEEIPSRTASQIPGPLQRRSPENIWHLLNVCVMFTVQLKQPALVCNKLNVISGVVIGL